MLRIAIALTPFRYAFDVVQKHGGDFLENRRIFAFCDNGIPDGIKVDTDGLVYSGCGDGVQVWHPSGKLIGKITRHLFLNPPIILESAPPPNGWDTP